MRLDLSPNPAAGVVAVRIQGGNIQGSVEAQVFDIRGRIVGRFPVLGSGAAAYSANVNLRDLASGLYFVRAVVAGKEIIPVKRLMVLR
jgi:hypothetical protein